MKEVSVHHIENADLYLITGDIKRINLLFQKLHVQFVQ